MKKLVFMFVAFAAISLASCDGTAKPAAGNADSLQADSTADTVQVDSVQADSVVADSVK